MAHDKSYKSDLECLLYPDLVVVETALSATHMRLCRFALCRSHGVLIEPLLDARCRASAVSSRQASARSREAGLSAALVRVLDHVIHVCQHSATYLDLMGHVILFLDSVRRRILWMGQDHAAYISAPPRRVRA